MNNKKGFTLIEIIAVIILIAIIMLIAVPSVSSIVDNSKKSAYLDIANAYVDAVRNQISSRNYNIPKTGYAYYIPIDIIEITRGAKQSPYGEWAKMDSDIKYTALDKDDSGNCSNSGTSAVTTNASDPFKIYNKKYAMFESQKTYTSAKLGCLKSGSISDAYVIVAYNTIFNKYEYVWASRDDTGHKIYPSSIEDISTEDIVIDKNPIGTFTTIEKYAVKVSRESNPTSGTKYTVSEFNARSIGRTNKVGLYFPDRSFGIGSSELDISDQEAMNCYTVEPKADGSVMITYYNPSCSKNVIIPNRIGGKLVTEIGAYAFAGIELESVVIPDSVTVIGSRAFYNNKINDVVYPTTAVTINSEAFSSNYLTEINVPSNATLSGAPFTNNKVSEENAFLYKTDVNGNKDYSVLIGYAGTSKDIVIPEKKDGVTPLKTIGSSAFRSLKLNSVSIPDSVTTIESWAFAGNNLTHIDYPSNLKSIGGAAFNGNKLTTLSNIPSSVNSISSRSFNNNSVNDGTEFVYARYSDGRVNYSKIVSYAGSNKNVTIPPTKEGVALTTITGSAFLGVSLKKIVGGIPSTVTSIGVEAFNANNVADADNPWIYARTSTGAEDKTKIIGYAGSNKNITIPSTVKVIGEQAFGECGIKTVVIPEGVTTIEKNAFRYNYVQNPTIPSTVTSIGSAAFCKEISWGKFNRFDTIINKTGKGFDWKSITCGHFEAMSNATGVLNHQVGDITITNG